MALPEAIQQARAALTGAISLMVATQRQDGFDAKKVLLAVQAATGLRELTSDWLDTIVGTNPVPYGSTAELGEGEVFLIEDAETVDELEPLKEIADNAVDLPNLAAADLDQRITLYGLIAGDVDRIVFVKRSDPRIGYAPGRGFLATLEERLERLTTPTFAFYANFDLVIAPNWVLVANQGAFERTFRDAGLVEQHIDAWVTSVDDQLPWSDGSMARLREVALRDSRVWRKLREIHRRGHLAGVTIDDVADYAAQMNLDLNGLIADGQIVFDPDKRFTVLHLLNEDLFRGPLSDERFEAQRKTGA